MTTYLAALTTIIGPVRPTGPGPKRVLERTLQLVQIANAFAEAATKYGSFADQDRLTQAAREFYKSALDQARSMTAEGHEQKD